MNRFAEKSKEKKIHCKTIFQHINKHSLDPLEGLNTDKIVHTVDGHGVHQLVSVELPHALNWEILGVQE